MQPTSRASFTRLFSAATLKGDVAGALSATMVGAPQAMAYGLIAVSALGPGWTGAGAFAGLLSVVAASLLSCFLSILPAGMSGPRAGLVLLFAGLVGHLAALPGESAPEALALSGLAIVGAGLLLGLIGLARLGRMADFIPYPVVVGFINGTGLLIVKSQIAPLLGLPAGPPAWQQIQPGAAALGLATILLILQAPRMGRRVPPLLLGLVVGTVVYHGLRAAGVDIPLGGNLPPLPDHLGFGLVVPRQVIASVTHLHADVLIMVVSAALSMAALAALDTIFTVVALDLITGRRTSTDREMMTQGLVTALSGLFGLLACAPGLSRSIPAVQAGGRTMLMHYLYTAMMVVAAFLLAPMVQILPKSVMAGVLIVIGLKMVDRWTLETLRRLRWRIVPQLPYADLLAMMTVVASALIYGLVVAVGVGMAVSLLFFLVRMSRSPIRRQYAASALAARVQDDSDRLAFARQLGHQIRVIELEGVLFFGSVAGVQRQAEALIAEGVRYIILDLKRVRELDTSAARVLERIHRLLAQVGGLLVMAYVEPERRLQAGREFPGEERRLHAAQRRLWRALDQIGWPARLDPAQLAPDIDSAVLVCERRLRDGGILRAEDDVRSLILRGIDRPGMRRLRPYLSRRHFAAGDPIFRQGDPPDSIYYIAAGRVDVTIDLPRTDRKLRVKTLARGAIFGEMAIIDPQPRSAYVTATESSICYRLSADNFERLKHEEVDLALRLLANTALVFAERLRASNTMIAELEA